LYRQALHVSVVYLCWRQLHIKRQIRIQYTPLSLVQRETDVSDHSRDVALTLSKAIFSQTAADEGTESRAQQSPTYCILLIRQAVCNRARLMPALVLAQGAHGSSVLACGSMSTRSHQNSRVSLYSFACPPLQMLADVRHPSTRTVDGAHG
jgi:hypothetical protein